MPAEALADDGLEDIGQHRRRKAGGVGVEDDEQGIVTQNAGYQLHKGIEVFLQPPHLAGGAPAVGGRVHDDGVVPAAPADFAFHIFGAVVHNPADGLIFKAGGFCVVPGPLHHALCGVHMAHVGSGGGAGHGGPAGVGEEVQDVHRPAGLFDLLPGKVPVGGLLWEKAGVLEVHGANMKSQVAVAHGPALGDVFALPRTAAGAGAGIAGVRIFPALEGAGGVPDGLGVGADQQPVSPALQLLAPPAVE